MQTYECAFDNKKRTELPTAHSPIRSHPGLVDNALVRFLTQLQCFVSARRIFVSTMESWFSEAGVKSERSSLYHCRCYYNCHTVTYYIDHPDLGLRFNLARWTRPGALYKEFLKSTFAPLSQVLIDFVLQSSDVVLTCTKLAEADWLPSRLTRHPFIKESWNSRQALHDVVM